MKRRSFLKASIAVPLVTISPENVLGKESNDLMSDNEGIIVRFLGTGAADWNGLDSRGELRRLSSILVDNHILFDLTAGNIEMIPAYCKPDVLFYTHSHKDHYDPETALLLGLKRIYLSQTWYDIAKKDFKEAADRLKIVMPEIIPLYVGQIVQIGELRITPLPASHVKNNLFEQTLIYLLEKDAARIIYATDTGGISALAARLAGIDAHDRNGKPITGLIMEATMGIDYDSDYRIFTHSSVDCVSRIVDVLIKTKRYIAFKNQPVYLTHMARTLHGTQDELDTSLPKSLKAAYDGLEVIFKSI